MKTLAQPRITTLENVYDCTCVFRCNDDLMTSCGLSGSASSSRKPLCVPRGAGCWEGCGPSGRRCREDPLTRCMTCNTVDVSSRRCVC
jgi:hypothetical protein